MTDKFESYDYGDQNMNHYGQETPITYDLSKVVVGCEYKHTLANTQVTAPTAIFKGDADDLADVADIDRLVRSSYNCEVASCKALIT